VLSIDTKKKITYALPSFAGQLTADDRNRSIGAISRKTQRRGVLCTEFDIDDLLLTANCSLTLLIPITVYIIYFHPQNTVPTASEKDNMVISYLTLNTISIKTVSSIAVSLT